MSTFFQLPTHFQTNSSRCRTAIPAVLQDEDGFGFFQYVLRKLSMLKIQFVADLELPLNGTQHPSKALVHTPSYIWTSSQSCYRQS